MSSPSRYNMPIPIIILCGVPTDWYSYYNL